MRSKRLVIGACLVISVVAATAFTQMVMRPYHSGSVWSISFIRTQAGMGNAYRTYLTSDWKREQEALKQEGIIQSYKVLSTESHGENDWDLMLMTEYKDLATMEANETRADALGQRMMGGDQKIEQGYRDRSSMRNLVGQRLAREVILEPRKP